MNKTKKKSKTAKLPKPIKVKKEKSDEERLPQSMTHYLDDRLEMVKQIFNTLKPKTIVNLAPDFIKTQALEDIEEACLNELLCISTKRLKSIISDTKCPTDTESSDNDSDVERHEERISLEEISSDSEIEGSTSKKARKKKVSKSRAEPDISKNDTPNENDQGDGQISVLELLELQARARAIRSQLALEPVTKIEVDSDGEKRKEKEKNKKRERDEKVNKSDRKPISSEKDSRDSAKVTRLNSSAEGLNIRPSSGKNDEKVSTKKIKIKRNYRTAASIDTNEKIQEKEDSVEEKDKIDKLKSKEKSLEQEKNELKEMPLTEIKKEKNSRSQSPDVIPIVAEPETLLITDSSGEENGTAKDYNYKGTKEETIMKQSEHKHTENEYVGIKNNIKNGSDQKVNEVEKEPDISTSAVNTENSSESTQHSQCKTLDKNATEDINPKSKALKISNKGKSRSNDGTISPNHSDDDRNEDVISLGGDLENEMNEQLENEVNAMQSPYDKKQKQEFSQGNKSHEESLPEDAISLDSSDDEKANDNQSWHSRYMKSTKVSKVLAASRLGKRVRDKIKKSKYAKKENSLENSDAEKEKTIFTSKHEDGSVEQYKELLEMRQRKPS